MLSFCLKQLPESKTKEPYYWNMSELFDLVKKAKVTLARAKVERTADFEPSLFPEFDKPTV